jgi:hypothetical protein
MRRAVTAAATWAGVGSPRRQAAKKACASASTARLAVDQLGQQGFEAVGHPRPSPGVDVGQIEEVGQQVVAVLGGDGFRVELYAVDRPRPVGQPHDLAVGGPCGDFQHVRQGFAADRQAVVAGGGEGRGQAPEHALARVLDRRGLAVHQGLGADHLAAEGLAHGLMAQADAEDRHVQRRAVENVEADARLVGRAGTGRQQDGLGLQRPGLGGRQVVVAHDLRLRAQLREVVDEVVGKAVVVIDDQDHGLASRGCGPPRQAPSASGAVSLR